MRSRSGAFSREIGSVWLPSRFGLKSMGAGSCDGRDRCGLWKSHGSISRLWRALAAVCSFPGSARRGGPSRAENGRHRAAELPACVLTVVGTLLLIWPAGRWRVRAAVVRPPPLIGWILLAVAALGIAFAWWARISLGTLWSASVTRKAEHQVIESGPYRFVRHPIYSGLLFAFTSARSTTAPSWRWSVRSC